jgi:hypothetical protein
MPRLSKRYHGPTYIIGMDTRNRTTSLLYQLQQVARNAAKADEAAGVVDKGPQPKHTPNAFMNALGDLTKGRD